MRISDFEAMTFDCYGTLIDWEAGIAAQLQSWAERHGVAADKEILLAAFAKAEAPVESQMPTALYPDILRKVHGKVASHFGIPGESSEADLLAQSVGDWPVFPDTQEALGKLKQRYRLVVVSNVDRASFARTQQKLGVELDALITAEDVGAYKPDSRVFERAFETLAEMGIDRSRVLHVAQSLYHDHVPAKKLGLATVWVNRRKGQGGWGATRQPEVQVVPDIEVASLAELVTLDDAEREKPTS